MKLEVVMLDGVATASFTDKAETDSVKADMFGEKKTF